MNDPCQLILKLTDYMHAWQKAGFFRYFKLTCIKNMMCFPSQGVKKKKVTNFDSNSDLKYTIIVSYCIFSSHQKTSQGFSITLEHFMEHSRNACLEVYIS